MDIAGRTTANTICLHPQIEDKLRKWLKERPTAAFLCIGPPGVGKTTLVYRVCKEEGYWIQELNASHTRTGTSFRDKILPLLREPGLSAWSSPSRPKGHAVVLDEMDGLSQGERGGLQELLKYLRETKKNGPIPLILICNELLGRKMQQIVRLCEVCTVGMPAGPILEKWIGRSLTSTEKKMDLRSLFRILEGYSPPPQQSLFEANNNNTIEDAVDMVGNDFVEPPSITIQTAWHTLYDKWDFFDTIDMDTKDANLAGLLYHQNLPLRLQPAQPKKGVPPSAEANLDAFNTYKRLHKVFKISDYADFWAFFHQCWPLLSISTEIKLKIANLFLQELPPAHKVVPVEQLEYTWVLTRQSALFNAWKEMCKLNDETGVDLRHIPDICIGGTTKQQKALSFVKEEIDELAVAAAAAQPKPKKAVVSTGTAVTAAKKVKKTAAVDIQTVTLQI
jgi:hypothetical protein